MRISLRRATLVCIAAAGGPLIAAVCADAVSINVGSVSGAAGTRVKFPVTVSTMGMQVAGTSNNITFDPATPVAGCTISAPFAGFSAATLLPNGCVPAVDCQGARIFIIQFPPIGISNGATLYTCDVQIAADAIVKSYPLTCSSPGASDPNGKALPAQCVDGQVQVVATPTPTPTGPTPTRTPTGTPVPGGGGGGGSCEVAPTHQSHACLLLFPAALLLLRRRVLANRAPVPRQLDRRARPA